MATPCMVSLHIGSGLGCDLFWLIRWKWHWPKPQEFLEVSAFVFRGGRETISKKFGLCDVEMLAQVHMLHDQTNGNIGVWSRQMFISGPCYEMGGSCCGWLTPKKPQAPWRGSLRGSSKVFLKGQVREGWGHKMCDLFMHNPLIGWWCGNRAMSQGSALSGLRFQEAWGHVLMVIN